MVEPASLVVADREPVVFGVGDVRGRPGAVLDVAGAAHADVPGDGHPCGVVAELGQDGGDVGCGAFVLHAGRGHERLGVATEAAPTGEQELVGAGRVAAAVAAVSGHGVALLGVVVTAFEVADGGEDRRDLCGLAAAGGDRGNALMVVPGVVGVGGVLVDECDEVVLEGAVPAGHRGGLPGGVVIGGDGAVPPDQWWCGDGGRGVRDEQLADGDAEQFGALLGAGVVPADGGRVDADEVGVTLPLRRLDRVRGQRSHGVGDPVGVGIGVGADRGRGGRGGAGSTGAAAGEGGHAENEATRKRDRRGGAEEKGSGAHTL